MTEKDYTDLGLTGISKELVTKLAMTETEAQIQSQLMDIIYTKHGPKKEDSLAEYIINILPVDVNGTLLNKSTQLGDWTRN